LLRSVIDRADGLATYLDEQFEVLTADPNSRSVRWRPADPIDLSLSAAVWRSQCLADWAETRRARAQLGRYYVASRLGTPDGVAPDAFNMLRRSGDEKATRAAAKAVAAVGPAVALRGEVEAVLRLSTWPQYQRAAIFALLAAGADLLNPATADRALRRVQGDHQIIAADAGNALTALARIVRAASNRAQTSASRLSRTLVEEWPEHALLVQDMARVVAAIRWPHVSHSERRLWIEYVEKNLDEANDHRFLAEAAASALSSTENREIARILTAAYDQNPSMVRLALLLDAGVTLPKPRRAEAVALVTRDVHRIQKAAHEGSYGFGGTVDPADLLARLVSRSPSDPAWKDLLAFATDDRVGLRDKVMLLDHFADRDFYLPRYVQDELRTVWDEITAVGDPLAPPEASLRGRILRLSLRLQSLDRKEVLSRLLALAGDSDRDGRLEAARTLPMAQRAIGDDAAFTLAISLTRDRDYTVRGLAGRALALLDRERADELSDLAIRRLVSLIGETGTYVPGQTLLGVIEAIRKGRGLQRDLQDVIVRVDRIHPSADVRRLAESALDETGSTKS
jgi:hypothetical protein